MDITIYYRPEAHMPNGAIERVTTPLESDFDRWKVGWYQSPKQPTLWCLMLQKWMAKKDQNGDIKYEWQCYGKYAPLVKSCGGIAEYEQWLEKTVSHITVDGIVFWANPGGTEEE